jgi:hypothetical protein
MKVDSDFLKALGAMLLMMALPGAFVLSIAEGCFFCIMEMGYSRSDELFINIAALIILIVVGIFAYRDIRRK